MDSLSSCSADEDCSDQVLIRKDACFESCCPGFLQLVCLSLLCRLFEDITFHFDLSGQETLRCQKQACSSWLQPPLQALSVWSILPPSKDMKEARTPVHAEFQLGVSVCVSQQQSPKGALDCKVIWIITQIDWIKIQCGEVKIAKQKLSKNL